MTGIERKKNAIEKVASELNLLVPATCLSRRKVTKELQLQCTTLFCLFNDTTHIFEIPPRDMRRLRQFVEDLKAGKKNVRDYYCPSKLRYCNEEKLALVQSAESCKPIKRHEAPACCIRSCGFYADEFAKLLPGWNNLPSEPSICAYNHKVREIPVKCLDTGEVFPSKAAAARHIGVSPDTFHRSKMNNGHWVRL